MNKAIKCRTEIAKALAGYWKNNFITFPRPILNLQDKLRVNYELQFQYSAWHSQRLEVHTIAGPKKARCMQGVMQSRDQEPPSNTKQHSNICHHGSKTHQHEHQYIHTIKLGGLTCPCIAKND